MFAKLFNKACSAEQCDTPQIMEVFTVLAALVFSFKKLLQFL